MIYLCFPDIATAIRCCPEWRTGKKWVAPTRKVEIAVRGALYNDDGAYDEQGNVIKQPTKKVGFFIDVIRGAIPAAAQEYVVYPTTPDFILG